MVIYIGNFAQTTTSDTLRDTFSRYGHVEDVTVIRDRISEHVLGFGFVTMPDANQGRQAIEGLKYSDIDGRTVLVAETTERPERRAEPRG